MTLTVFLILKKWFLKEKRHTKKRYQNPLKYSKICFKITLNIFFLYSKKNFFFF